MSVFAHICFFFNKVFDFDMKLILFVVLMVHGWLQELCIVSFFDIPGCGGDVTAQDGSLVSPNYPLPYHDNVECYWRITIARWTKILLTFVDLDLESHTNCSYDYIEVRSLMEHSNSRAKVISCHFMFFNITSALSGYISNKNDSQ